MVRPFRTRPDIPDPLRAAWLAALDIATGKLLDALDRLNLTSDTIFVLTATTVPAAPLKKNAPAEPDGGRRGGRGSPYEGGHCVPMLVRWPAGNIGAGDMSATAAHIDLLPTLSELCRLPLPESCRPDGISLASLLMTAPGETPPASPPERVLIVDAQDIPVPIQWRRNCVLSGPWRLINGRELYDLRTDPAQRRNIAADHSDIVEQLRGTADAWWQSLAPDKIQPAPVLAGGAQDPVLLTPQEWICRTPPVMTREDVLRGTPAHGQWLMEIARDGNYDILLRRWPLTVNRMLSDNFFVPEKARLRAGTFDETRAVPAGATGISFRAALKQGPLTLQTWLSGGGKSSSAFFVEVRRAVEVRAAKPVPQ
jgi:arylsulfatase B